MGYGIKSLWGFARGVCALGNCRLGVVALMLAALPLNGCKLLEDLFDSSDEATKVRSAPPPGTTTGGCDLTTTERQTLVDLVLTPVSCSDTEPCPKGSFCDAEHNHTCNWQCLSNSDCGTGTCECNGKCSDSPPTPPPGDTTAASCPRDNALLDAVKDEPRRCEWDDECPYGSHCDRTSGHCDWTCRDPDQACTSGEVCDCLGNCIASDSDPERPKQRLPSLSVSSPTVTVIGSPSDDDWQRAVVVRLTTGDESLLVGTGSVRTFEAGVSVTAGSRLLVSCNAFDMPPDFSPDCTLDGGSGEWEFRRTGDVWVAFQTLLLQPNPSADINEVDEAALSVRLFSARVDASPRLVSVEFNSDTTEAEWQPVTPAMIEANFTYTGTMVLKGPADLSSEDTALGQDVGIVEVPVEAVLAPNCEDGFFFDVGPCFIVRDPIHSLTAGTLLRLPIDGSPLDFRVLEAPGIGGKDYRHALRLGSLSRATKTGSLSGVLKQIVNGREEDVATLSLSPRATETCNSNDDCVDGETCFLGTICGENAERFPGPDNTPPTYNQQSKAWVQRVDDGIFAYLANPETMASDALGLAPRLYDPTFGLGASPIRGLFEDKPFVEHEKLAVILEDRSDPQAECLLSVRALAEQGLLPIGSGPPFGGPWTAAEILAGATATCQNFTRSNGFAPSIACRGRNLAGGNGVERADCTNIYANIKAASPIALPDSYLDHCTLRTLELSRVQGGQGFATGPKEIGLCSGWERVAFPPIQNGAELNHCFSGRPSGHVSGLVSGTLDLTARPLAFSGDLPCSNASIPTPSFPSGATLLLHRDIRSPPFDAPTLLGMCKDDLTRPPPGDLDEDRDFPVLFGGRNCFDAGSFYTALLKASAAPEERTGRFFLRLTQQWAELNTFVANEARQELTMPAIDAQVNGPTTPPTIDLPTLIELLNQAAVLELVQPWDSIPAGLLRNPIYRPLGIPEKAEWEERYGPAPALLELATAQMNVLEQYANDAALVAYQDRLSGAVPSSVRVALKKYGDGLRFALALERLSGELYSRAFGSELACGTETDCVDTDFDASFNAPKCVNGLCRPSVWAERWLRARDALRAARSRAILAGRMLASGENPLGVSENDLPLFFGDLTGTNSRFFASSDYLMSTWAVSAVATAREALDEARSAWIQQRNSKVQDDLLAAERDRRLEAIRSNAGTVVASNCGLDKGTTADEVLDRLAKGDFDLASCYIVPESENPACALGADPVPPDENAHSAAIRECADHKIRVLEDRNLATGDFFKDPCHAWFRDNPLTDAEINVWAQANPSNWVVDCCGWPICFACGMHWITVHDNKRLGFFAGDGPVADGIEAQQAARGLHSCAEDGFGHFWDPTEKQFLDCDAPLPGFFCNSHDNLCFKDVEGFVFDSNNSVANGGPGTPLHPAVVPFQTCSVQKYSQDRQSKLQANVVSAQDRFAAEDECEQGDALGAVAAKVRRASRPLECYRGGLGSAAIRVLKAQQEADLVEIQWAEKQLEYSIQGRLCAGLEADATRLAERNTAFNDEMRNLRETRDFFSDFQKMIGIEAALVSGNEGTAGVGFATMLIGDLQAGIERQMADLSAQHQAFLQQFAQDQAIKACFIEADKIRATFTSARERIVIQATEASDALATFRNLMTETQRAVGNGRTQLDREAGRTFGGYTFHYWYDEKLSRFQREFSWARRLVFLAMRAVEYEFQQSLPIRNEILTATNPDQLEAALQSLQQEVANRAINRRRPDEASAVVSLRDDVLGLKDHTDAPAGERAYSSSLVFRSRIWDPRYAVRDATGNYLGQGVPFSLAPQGTLTNRCAERLWRVTATLQGDGLSQSEPGAPVMLFKANTFSSQWCKGHEQPDRPTQVGTIQPSRNLFKDFDGTLAADDAAHYSVASLYPWFNVRRADFFRLEYQEGASEELAGRGLYGDYILLFPRELLEGHASVVPPPDGDVGVSVRDEVFPLDHVEDVLLRFDYLSVDNYPEVGN